MAGALADLHVLVLDCQASGATPAHGDLLELGWGVTGATQALLESRARWIVPASERRVSAVVRKLTGWSEACREQGLDALEAWQMLLREAQAEAHAPMPTVIHFARFELTFLRDLHARAGGTPDTFPIDAVCLHAIAERVFPELPRRNLRALAGHLGHSAELVRRAHGHVEATAAIWRALLPHLQAREITSWAELKAWLAVPTTRTLRKKRVFPMPPATRRALPDGPGVYRFLRPNGDVLYVGKATSLRKRVASHFAAGQRTTERALEMLSQAHHIDATETPTVLEAALLETDEIKRLDPPYNVQLRAGERAAWFARLDWTDSAPAPDPEHPVGPLPSRYALAGIAAMRALLEGADCTPRLCAAAVETPLRDAPTAQAFAPVWRQLVAEHLSGRGTTAARLLAAGSRLVAPESPADAAPGWDEARILRHLERALIGGATLIRRARLLSLLSHCRIRFYEPGASAQRTLHVQHGALLPGEAHAPAEAPAPPRPPPRLLRLACFDAHRYDRLRVLATELRRIQLSGGGVHVEVGAHCLPLTAAAPDRD